MPGAVKSASVGVLGTQGGRQVRKFRAKGRQPAVRTSAGSGVTECVLERAELAGRARQLVPGRAKPKRPPRQRIVSAAGLAASGRDRFRRHEWILRSDQ